MAFNMSYAFEGNFRSRPEQNLSGASRKQSKEALLQKVHEERQKRQEQRLKLQSTETLQSHIRSYLARKHKKQEERSLFDENESNLNIHELLRKLIFFYDPEIDNGRFVRILKLMLVHYVNILKEIKQNNSLKWLVSRMLVITLTFTNTDLSDLMMEALNKFGNDCDVLQYLVGKCYFQQLMVYMETHSDLSMFLKLLHRPLTCLHKYNSSIKEKVLFQFCNAVLSDNLSYSIKHIVLPYLRDRKNFPFAELIHYLYHSMMFSDANVVFYCILALEPLHFEPNKEYIEVLSKYSINLYQLNNPLIDLTEDSDEEMEVCDEIVNVVDITNLFNNHKSVWKILNFFMNNSEDEQVLLPLMELCLNLLLLTKQFLLVAMLALRGEFVAKLWQYIQRQDHSVLKSTSSLIIWKPIYASVAVFCDTFMLYTKALTDAEKVDTSKTFTNSDLNKMSELLKNISLSLIELAFPMCRTNSAIATPQLIHLYNSCLGCVKVLYTLNLRRNFSSADFWTQKKIHISPDLTKKNYLSKTIQPFCGIVEENDEEHLPPLSTIEQRSLAILQDLPFLIDFNTRVLLLRHLCFYSLGNTDEVRLRQEFMTDNAIVVRRTHLYEDAFEKLLQKSDSDFKQRVRIQFINSMGLEEAGIDGGGIFKEFLNEVLKTAFDPNRGFFMLTADNMLYPNPNVHLIVDNFSDHYYFMGRLVGKAIFENILVDLPLAEFFLAKLLVDKASAYYLKSLDPVLYRNLLYLRDYQGDVQDLGLDFTLVNSDLGETRVVELKEDGSNIPVTNHNRLEYINLLADLKLNQQIKKQCRAFREGINSVVPLLWLKLFNPNELQVIIGGDTQEMDINDLQAYTAYGGDFTIEHPTIELFWKILRTFTSTQKKQLLKFVTSCSRPPLLGFKELNPSFCIQSSGTEDRMPTASTCLNLLKLPIITVEETLRKKLLAAIEQQAGFELS